MALGFAYCTNKPAPIEVASTPGGGIISDASTMSHEMQNKFLGISFSLLTLIFAFFSLSLWVWPDNCSSLREEVEHGTVMSPLHPSNGTWRSINLRIAHMDLTNFITRFRTFHLCSIQGRLLGTEEWTTNSPNWDQCCQQAQCQLGIWIWISEGQQLWLSWSWSSWACCWWTQKMLRASTLSLLTSLVMSLPTTPLQAAWGHWIDFKLTPKSNIGPIPGHHLESNNGAGVFDLLDNIKNTMADRTQCKAWTAQCKSQGWYLPTNGKHGQPSSSKQKRFPSMWNTSKSSRDAMLTASIFGFPKLVQKSWKRSGKVSSGRWSLQISTVGQ